MCISWLLRLYSRVLYIDIIYMYFYISLAFLKNIACKSIDKKKKKCLYPFPNRQKKDQVINEIVFSVKPKEKYDYGTNFVY